MSLFPLKVPLPNNFKIYGTPGSSYYSETKKSWILAYMGNMIGSSEYEKETFGFYIVEWVPNVSSKIILNQFVKGHGWLAHDEVYGLWVWGIEGRDVLVAPVPGYNSVT